MANEQARLQQVAPALRIPAEIGGSVLAAVGTGGLASLAGRGLAAAIPAAAPAVNALSTASPLLRYAGAGAIQGGAQGASDAPTNADIIPDALQGAGVGAALGAAVPIAGKVFGATRQAFSPGAGSSVSARRGIAKAIGRDSETPADVEGRAATLAAARPGSALWADALGENGQGVVERIATRPGAGMSQVIPALKARQVGQIDRVSSDLASLSGGTKKDAFTSIQQQMKARAAAAAPLYAKAMNFDPAGDGDLLDAWSEATRPGTYGEAAAKGTDLKRMLMTVHDQKPPSPEVKDAEGNVTDPGVPLTMQALDIWKKTMDDMQGAALRSGENAKARAIRNSKDMVVEAVDTANPDYAQARQAWAGPSAYADAIELGRDLITKGSVSPAEFTTTYNGLSDSEKEGFRIGASSNLQGGLRSNSAVAPDLTKGLRSQAMREKISAMMTPEAAADFNRKLDFEVQAAALHAKAVGGSPTARRLAAAEDHDQSQGINLPGAVSVAANTITKPIAAGAGIAMQAGKKVLGKIVDSKRAATDAKQAAFLMSPIDPARTNALSQFLARPTARPGSNALSFSKLGAITAGNTVANQRR